MERPAILHLHRAERRKNAAGRIHIREPVRQEKCDDIPTCHLRTVREHRGLANAVVDIRLRVGANRVKSGVDFSATLVRNRCWPDDDAGGRAVRDNGECILRLEDGRHRANGVLDEVHAGIAE